MESDPLATTARRRRLAAIGAAVAVMIPAVVALGAGLARRGVQPPHPPAAVVPAARPIPSEADVFRRSVVDLADGPAPAEPEHARSLAMSRRIRAYPGAPPRIPHGLTGDEFRAPRCNACHERGGWSDRFGAYAPVTPHPELRQCLQCHAVDDALVGIPFPDARPGRRTTCDQCHVLDVSTPVFVPIDWPEPAWPALGRQAMAGSPPVIPHDLHLRGDCVACHAGPGAAAEIRTDHPERVSCRQCHVPAESVEDGFLPRGSAMDPFPAAAAPPRAGPAGGGA